MYSMTIARLTSGGKIIFVHDITKKRTKTYVPIQPLMIY